MTYPSSSEVSAGDATLASHYNNLRSDALFLGQSAEDAVTLALLLERYESRLKIERLSTTRLRVPASETEPVSMIIDGYMVQALVNIDLAEAAVPTGSENTYYIFANRADGSTSFTLSISTSITEAVNQRRIGRCYWDGAKIVKDSIRTEFSIQIKNLLYYVEPQICEGRLTVSTGVSVPSSDVSASANVYFTPHSGNRVALYVPNYGWRLYTFGELTLDISAVATDKNLDIWLYDNAGTLTLAYTEWSNDTLRSTSIVRQDGIYCKNGALNYRYLGTVRTSAAGYVCDTKEKRFVWNFYNRVERPFYRHDSTSSWTYTVRAFRPWNNSDNNRVEFVVGVDESPVNLHFMAINKYGSGNIRCVGIGFDSTDTPADDSIWGGQAVSDFQLDHAAFLGYSGIGYHYLQLLEVGYASTITFYGSYTFDVEQIHSGASGSIFA